VGNTSRSSDLICVEASQVRVSQSDLKTGGATMAGGHRRGCVESKLKMDDLMRRAASDHLTPDSAFSLY
jgi:hypothetical protein